MLFDAATLLKKPLIAIDGEVGNIEDVYFEDDSWAVRYLEIDAGSWLNKHAVLISPHAIKSIVEGEDRVNVQLTKRQIEASPSINQHKPISRQYEEDYYNYYGWPNYWDGNLVWGQTPYPVLVQSPALTVANKGANYERKNPEDSHLRSLREVIEYELHGTKEPLGQVSGFMTDDRGWVIHQIVVNAGG